MLVGIETACCGLLRLEMLGTLALARAVTPLQMHPCVNLGTMCD
jgi:hypothetical protein